MNNQNKAISPFGQVERAVLTASTLTSADKTVYTVIASFRNTRSGKAWPGRDTLSQITGLHVDSISRSTARLVKTGFLVKVHAGRNRVVYSLPLADQRQADRAAQASTTTAADSAGKPRRPRRARVSAESSSDCTVRTEPADSFICDLDEEFPPDPPLPPVLAEPAGPCGEEVEQAVVQEGAVDPIVEQQVERQQEPGVDQRADGQEPASQEGKNSGIAIDTALFEIAIIEQIVRVLAGLPHQTAQQIADELSFNARGHTVLNPAGYTRRLCQLHAQGKLRIEVAHLEEQRRRRRQQIEQSIAANNATVPADEYRRPPPAPPPTTRSAESIAIAERELAKMKALRRPLRE